MNMQPLPAPLSEEVALAVNLKAWGIHCNKKCIVANSLIYPIAIALLTITILGMAGVLSPSITGWTLCAIGGSVFLSNLLWGQIKQRKCLFSWIGAYSLIMMALGILGGMGMLPVTTFSAGILATYFTGTCCLCYSMGGSFGSAGQDSDTNKNGTPLPAGHANAGALVLDEKLARFYKEGNNHLCPCGSSD